MSSRSKSMNIAAAFGVVFTLLLGAIAVSCLGGCATRQNTATTTPVVAKRAVTTTTPTRPDSVDRNVTAIQIKEVVNPDTNETKVVYEEQFEQPTTVKRGSYNGKIFLSDGTTVQGMKHCLTWTDKNGNSFHRELTESSRVVYIFAGVTYDVSEQASN